VPKRAFPKLLFMPKRPLSTLTLSTLILFGAACIEVPKPPPRGAIDVRDVDTTDDVQLETACTPTGIELCFDAYDNNCNGVIDEGCGLNTGILQFTIAWSEAAADIDLNVSGPDGETARFDRPNDAGLLKDRDCPGADNQCYGQNIENVFLAEGNPRRGRYRVIVRLEDLRDATAPIKVRLSARIGQRHFSTLVELKERNDERKFEFTL
jgi:tRNA (guanosine-2'-O-)-methyltransferase